MIFQEYILHHLLHYHGFVLYHQQCKGTMKPVLTWHHLELVTLWNMVLNTSNSHLLLLLQTNLIRGMMNFAQDGNWAFFFPFYLNNDSLCTYLFIPFLCDTVAAASRTCALKDYEWFAVKFAAYNCFPCVSCWK